MADFTNKQLAEIVSQSAEDFSKSTLRQRKIANELIETSNSFVKHIQNLENKIKQLEETSVKPDLSQLNQFYEEKTADNVKRLNSRLNVPNLAIYIWLFSVGLFFSSGVMIYFSSKSKQEIITEYQTSLKENGKVIITNGENILFDDMFNWFEKNPNTKANFIQWRENKKDK